MSRLKRKKQQDKKIAQKKIEPIQPIEEQEGKKKREKRQVEPLPKQYKALVFSFFGIVLVGVIILIVVLAVKDRNAGDPKYFEEYQHINVDHYKVLTRYNGYFDENELNEDDREVYDELATNLKSKIFIFIYNPLDENWNKELEEFITSKLDETDKSYTLLLMDYSKNSDIDNLVPSINELETFILISVENNKLGDITYQTVKSIKFELS